MTKSPRQIRIAAIVFEAAFLAFLFVPAAFPKNSVLTTPEIAVYALANHFLECDFFLFIAFGIPVAICLILFLLKPLRRAFGVSVCVSAFQGIFMACFFSSIRLIVPQVNWIQYVLSYLPIACMILLIFGFLLAWEGKPVDKKQI
jgi:hypothetical protein